VYPEQFLAQKKLNWLCTSPAAPYTGTRKWSEKATVVTLEMAIGRIYHSLYHGATD
jgi:hypothetical protein